ncbi:MAG: hypothetical protein ACLR4A_06515 [Christensenellales bacterium]
MTAVKDLVGQKAKAQYDDYNNLISYVQPGALIRSRRRFLTAAVMLKEEAAAAQR